MSLKYIRLMYGVPARKGGRVRYSPPVLPAREGTITRAEGAHIMVRLDGQRHPVAFHPEWHIEYLP